MQMHITCHASVPEHNIECFQIWLYCECMGCGNADCRGSHTVMHAARRLTHRATTAHDVLIKVCKCAAGSENRWRRGSKEGGNPAGEQGLRWQCKALTLDLSLLHHPRPSADPWKWTASPSLSPSQTHTFMRAQTHAHSHSTTNSPESTEAYLNSFFFFTSPFPSPAPSSPPLLFAVSCLTSPLSSSQYLRS